MSSILEGEIRLYVSVDRDLYISIMHCVISSFAHMVKILSDGKVTKLFAFY
jgi:hypothetical protein